MCPLPKGPRSGGGHQVSQPHLHGDQATGKEADGRQATGTHTRAARKQVCKTHAKQELVFHCCPCDVLMCPLCRKTTHQGHDTEDIVVASERIRAQVRDLLRNVEVKVKVVTEVITEVSRTEQDLERQRQAVVSEAVEAAGKVSAWANQAEDNLVKEVNKMADPVKDELLKRKTAAREVNATLILLKDRAKLVMKTGSYAELQSLRSDLDRNLVSDGTQSLEKCQGQLNPLVHADAHNVNSGGVCMPQGVRTKDTVFFKRRFSGQDILQNTVPRYVGDVTSGQAEDVAKTTAFTLQPGQQFETYCVDVNGEGFSLLNNISQVVYLTNPRTEKKYPSHASYICLMRRNLKDESVQHISFKGRFVPGNRLMQPWLTDWLFFSSGRLQVLKNTEQYKNEDPGELVGPSAIFDGVLSNSSPNGHVYAIHNGGSGYVFEIQLIALDPDGSISVKPLFQVVHRNALHGFDVSSDEAYFATIYSFRETVDDKTYLKVEVNVYQRLEAQPCFRFTKSARADRARNLRGDAFEACLCFSR